jgi:hypothetical protein
MDIELRNCPEDRDYQQWIFEGDDWPEGFDTLEEAVCHIVENQIGRQEEEVSYDFVDRGTVVLRLVFPKTDDD